jgi:O-antigen/teichoic acid export membrane protein
MIKRLFSSQLRVNMFSGVVATIASSVVLAIAYPVYLHFLGYEKYGVWLVLATVLTFAQLGNLGIGPAIIKLVAEEYGRGNIEGIQRYVITAMALLCVSGTVVLMVILALKTPIIAAFKLSDKDAETVSWLLPYIGVLSIYVFVVRVFEAALSGLGRMDLTNYIQSFGRVANVVVSSLLLYIGSGIKSMLIGSIISYLLIHIINLICIRRIAPIRFLQISGFDVYRCKRLLHFGGAVFGGSLIDMLFSPFNKLMLSRYVGVSAIPIYEIAYTGSMQIRALFETALRSMMPEVSRISANITMQAKNRISQLNSYAMKLIFLFGIPVYVALFIFAPLLLKLWLGERCVETLPGVFRIMLVGAFLSLLGIPAFHTLMGVGHIRSCFLGFAIPCVINAFLVAVRVVFLGTLSLQYVASSVVAGTTMSTFYLIWHLCRTRTWLPFDERGAKVEATSW